MPDCPDQRFLDVLQDTGNMEDFNNHPYSKHNKDTSLGNSCRPISLLCLAAKVLECLISPSVNVNLLLAQDQHVFLPGHSTTSALLQLTTDTEMGFNQRRSPDRTICVAVHRSAESDTVSHNILISKIS